MRTKYVVVVVVVGILLSATAVLAGRLEPPSGPTDPASQMYTLEQIYDRLDTGAAVTKMRTFTEPVAGPGETGRTLEEVMGLALAISWADPPCFDNTNRYVDCGDGTVHDTVTNLIWLKNANCYGLLDYAAANIAAAGLEHGECGLTDSSSPGDWRLPTKEEWETTVARAVALHCNYPCLTNTPGTACYGVGPSAFTDVLPAYGWSSTAYADSPASAWFMNLLHGYANRRVKTYAYSAWPVRGGQ